MLSGLTPALCGALCCAVLSLRWAQRMRDRAAALSGWRRALLRMEGSLLLHAELAALLENAAKGETDEAAVFLSSCAAALRLHPRCTLCEAAQRQRSPSLREEDLAALSPLFERLGSGGAEESMRLVTAVRREVEERLSQARAEWAKNRRLSGALGGIGAATVFLFLL